MKIQVTVNNVIIQEKNILNENEYNVHECEFEFVEEYNGLTKKAVFTGIDGKTYVQTIVDDKCYIPSEILAKRQNVKIGVYGYDVENEELILRYSPRPTEFTIQEGSYKEGENTTPPTPSEVEQLQAQITSNKNDIEEIQGDIVDINSDIADIKAEQTEQNTRIQNNTDNISTINGQIVTINADIDNLERTKADKSEIPTKTSDLINDSDFVSDSEYVHTDNNFTNEKDAQITTNASNITTLQSTKADKSEIPTKTSQLTNDSGFITKNVDDLANYYKKSETYNKTEVDGKVSSVYKYKGTVATYQDLPSTDLTIGDVYNVESDGSNYAWTGTTWDKLGGDIDLSEYYTKTQTDSLLSAKANASDVYTKNETYNKTEVNTLLNDKVDKVDGKGLSTEDFTTAEKTKLAGIESEANRTIVDSSLDDTSTNPVENQVIYASQETQNARISELEQDVDDLRNASYKVSGTGTDITLNNTAKGRLLKNDLSGRTEQTQLSGKNLAWTGWAEDFVSRINNSDLASLIINGGRNCLLYSPQAGYGDYENKYIFKTDFEENTQYTFQFDIKKQTSNTPTFAIEYTDGTSTSIPNVTAINTWQHITLTSTAGKTIKYARANYTDGGTFIDLNTFMVEKGSTATSYEPYCGGIPSPNPDFPQQIKNVTGNANVKIQNKNLALNDNPENPDANYSSSGGGTSVVQYDTNELGYYTKRHRVRDFGVLEPGTYVFSISAKFKKSGTYKILTSIKGYNQEIITGSLTNSYQRFTYTFDLATSQKFSIALYDTLYWKDIQLEQGSAATSYVPHEEQNLPFTFSEGQRGMQGTTLKDDGIHNLRKQIVLTGNETWNKINYSSTEGYNYFTTSSYDNIIGTKTYEIYSNYFSRASSRITPSYVTTGDCISGTNVNEAVRVRILIQSTTANTVEEFKNWLKSKNQNNTPVIIEFELADSELESNTIQYNSTQQAQYNAIKQARSYDNQTNISSTSTELGFNLNVESLGNINTVINNLLNN